MKFVHFIKYDGRGQISFITYKIVATNSLQRQY
jgi:hypothetical protein